MTHKLPSFKGSYRLIVDSTANACECAVCGFVLRDDKDMASYFDKGACTECVDTYYYPNADKWQMGWRPNKEEIK